MRHRIKVSLLTGMLLLLLFAFHLSWKRSVTAQTLLLWVTETVDSTESCFDMQVSLALSSDGTPHISYFDSEASALMYAHKTNSGWTNEVVDNSEAVGRHSSIALDSLGYPHISYRDMTKNALKYARWNGTNWDIVFIGSNEYGWYSSLAIDSNNYPHIAYLGNHLDTGTQTPKYAYWNGSQWEINVIDDIFTSGGTSLALNSAGTPHVSYHYRGELRYAVYTNPQWITETVDSKDLNGFPVGVYSSIAIDNTDNPHISYALYGQNFSPPYPDDLKYTKKQAGNWQFELPDTMGQVGFYSSIGLDVQSKPHISYFDSDNSALKYAHWDGANWTTAIVDTPVSMDGYTSLEVDQNGQPHIAYCNAQSKAIKYARLVSLNNRIFLPIIVK